MRLLIFAVICAAVTSLGAATYYVEKTGDDEDDGSIGNPWLTVQHALDTMVAGDTTLVGPGTYQEHTITERDGTAANRITLNGQGQAVLSQLRLEHQYYDVVGFTFRPHTNEMQGWIMYFDYNAHNNVISNNLFDMFFVWKNSAQKINAMRWAPVVIKPYGWDETDSDPPGSTNIICNNLFTHGLGAVTMDLKGTENAVFNNRIIDGAAIDYVWTSGTSNHFSFNVCSNIEEFPAVGNHPDFTQTLGDTSVGVYNPYSAGSWSNLFCGNLIYGIWGGGLYQNESHNSHFVGSHVFINNVFAWIAIPGGETCPRHFWFNNLFFHCAYSGGGHPIAGGYRDYIYHDSVASGQITNGMAYHYFTSGSGNLLLYDGLSIANDKGFIGTSESTYTFSNPSLGTNVVKVVGWSGGHTSRVYNNVFLNCGINGGTRKSDGWYTYRTNIITDILPSYKLPLSNVYADFNYVAKVGYAAVNENPNHVMLGEPIPLLWNNDKWWEDHGINGGDPDFAYGTNSLVFLTKSTSFLRGAGTNLSHLFNIDAKGRTRSAWDIGPFEYHAGDETGTAWDFYTPDDPYLAYTSPKTHAQSISAGANAVPFEYAFTKKAAVAETVYYTNTQSTNWFQMTVTNGTLSGERDTNIIWFDAYDLPKSTVRHLAFITNSAWTNGVLMNREITPISILAAQGRFILVTTNLFFVSGEVGSDAPSTNYTMTMGIQNLYTNSWEEFRYTNTTSDDWIQLSAYNGTVTSNQLVDTITVSFNSDALPPGQHRGYITNTCYYRYFSGSPPEEYTAWINTDIIRIFLDQAESGLLLHLSFDELGDNYVPDTTTNNNHAYFFNPTNNIELTNAGAFGSPCGLWTIKYTNSAPYPESQYLGVTNVSQMQRMTTGTLSVWAKFDAKPINQVSSCLVDSSYNTATDPAASNSFRLWRYASARFVAFSVYSTTNSSSEGSLPIKFQIDSLADTSTGELNLYTVTWDTETGDWYGYYNGIQQRYTNFTGVPFVRAYEWICIGAARHQGDPEWPPAGDDYPNDRYHAGLIDDLRLYNRALSADEVYALATNDVPEFDPAVFEISPTSWTLSRLTNSIAPQTTYDIYNSGNTDFEITYSNFSSAAWLQSSLSSGAVTSETDENTITIDMTGLTDGVYSGWVTNYAWTNGNYIDTDLFTVSLTVTNGVDEAPPAGAQGIPAAIGGRASISGKARMQ